MTNYIENILLGICDKLQLSPTLYSQARERYTSIAQIIQNDAAFAHTTLHVYPHGSFRLKTTVRPLDHNEYDLDFVAELPANSLMTPQDLYNHIVRILQHDGIHGDMVELKNRCIRVNYANDFHLDIMPGKLVNHFTREIIVPDRELKGWNHHSNPAGFADWFERQAKNRIRDELIRLRKSKFSIEPVTEQEVTSQLEPLRRAVQLVKRYRDIFCAENHAEPVRSIVLCTLMGNIPSYSGDTLQILSSFCNYVNSKIAQNNGHPFVVTNPVVDEVLTEKWAEGNNYRDFIKMMNSLTSDIMTLRNYSINSEINALIKKMFGEKVTNTVLAEHVKKLNDARLSGQLAVNAAGTLTTSNSGIPVKKNTFYGH